MADLTIVELVRNGTMCADAAALLWAMAEERHSFLVVAIPRFAGKSTTTRAILGLLPQSVPVHQLSGDMDEMDRLKQEASGGYLVVGEFSQAPVPTYIWGEPVRRVFDTLTAGYALTAALHASSLDEALQAICRGNGISDEAASRISYLLYIRRFGESEDTFWRRLAEIHEIDRVVNGKPQGRLLHRWVEDGNRFETVAAPRLLHASEADLRERSQKIAALAQEGRTSYNDVATLVAANQKTG